jgi:hypothetical protein
MAPEQARSEVDRLGPRSDLFALGSVLYYLLVGQPPFAASTVDAALDRARRCAFDRAALRAAKVPRQLATICLRAMAADPADRHHSADDLARDLEHYAQPPRFRLTVLGGIAAALLLVLVVGWVLREPSPVPSPELRGYVTRRTQDGEQRYKLSEVSSVTTSDKFFLSLAPIPAEAHLQICEIDAEGQVTEFRDYALRPTETGNEAVWPGKTGEVRRLTGPPGTRVFLLLVGRREPIPAEVIQEFFKGEGRLRKLPSDTQVRFDRNQAEAIGAAKPRGTSEDDLKAVRDRLDDLRVLLRDRCVFLVGIAFPLED